MLAEVEAPSSKTEVRAFLGMVRQFESWTPNLSCMSKYMRTLTNANVHLKLTEECQKEFINMKKIIGSVDFLM